MICLQTTSGDLELSTKIRRQGPNRGTRNLRGGTMLDHIILTVSDVERSLAFYKVALKPLNIKFFMPYKGSLVIKVAMP